MTEKKTEQEETFQKKKWNKPELTILDAELTGSAPTSIATEQSTSKAIGS